MITCFVSFVDLDTLLHVEVADDYLEFTQFADEKPTIPALIATKPAIRRSARILLPCATDFASRRLAAFGADEFELRAGRWIRFAGIEQIGGERDIETIAFDVIEPHARHLFEIEEAAAGANTFRDARPDSAELQRSRRFGGQGNLHGLPGADIGHLRALALSGQPVDAIGDEDGEGRDASGKSEACKSQPNTTTRWPCRSCGQRDGPAARLDERAGARRRREGDRFRDVQPGEIHIAQQRVAARPNRRSLGSESMSFTRPREQLALHAMTSSPMNSAETPCGNLRHRHVIRDEHGAGRQLLRDGGGFADVQRGVERQRRFQKDIAGGRQHDRHRLQPGDDQLRIVIHGQVIGEYPDARAKCPRRRVNRSALPCAARRAASVSSRASCSLPFTESSSTNCRCLRAEIFQPDDPLETAGMAQTLAHAHHHDADILTALADFYEVDGQIETRRAESPREGRRR